MQFTSRDLTLKPVSSSYGNVVQGYTPEGTASYLLDGFGNVIAYLPTSSIGQQIITKDQTSPNSITSSYTFTSSYSVTSDSASYLIPGGNIYLSQSYIYANINSTAPPQIDGQMWWDAEHHTYAIDNGHTRLQIGQENYVRVEAGEDLIDGQLVYIDGTNPQGVPIAWLALADGTNTISNVIGMVTQPILTGEDGFVTTAGVVSNLNTFPYTNGDPIFLSDIEPGGFTLTPPLYPAEKVVIGTIMYAHPTVGSILVNLIPASYREDFNVGVVDTPILSNIGNLVTIGSTTVNFCTTANGKGIITNHIVPSASFIVSSSFLDVQFVVATYNDGNPIYRIDTDLNNVDDIQTTPVATFTMGTSGIISYVDWDNSGILLSNKLNRRIINLYGAQRSNGLLLSTSASHIKISDGEGYIGIKQLTFTTASSENTGKFVLLSHSASIWSGSVINGWINNVYDNGTNLQTLSSGLYVVNYVFRGIGNLNRSQVMLSTQYSSYADAVESTMPTPPPELTNIAILVGRIITQEGVGVRLVESSFTTIFSVAGVTDHNNLNNLQGGTVGQYYHLTVDEYNGSGTGKFIRQSGSFITGSISNAETASWALNTPASVSSSHADQSDSANQSNSSSYLNPGATLYVFSGSNGEPSSYLEPYNIPTVPYTPPYKEGRMFYDADLSDWVYYNDKAFKLHIGKETIWKCRNASVSPLLKGTPVYISGSTYDSDPDAWPAIADGTNRYSDVVGIVRYTIPAGSTGYIIQNGFINNINMSGFNIGDPIFLSPTILGGLTNIEPGQPYESVRLGNVHDEGSNGSLIISPVFKLPPVIAYDGITSDILIDNPQDGTIIVSTGSVNLYNTPTGYGGVLPWALAETTLNLITSSNKTLNPTNYVVAERSGSNAVYNITTDQYYANGISIVRVATIDINYKNVGDWDLHIFYVGIVGLALANRTNNKDIRLYGYQRESGLTLYTTGSDRHFGITEGNIWYGPNSHIVTTFDTTLSGHYTYIFHTTSSNGTSSWHNHTSSLFINNYYDNGTELTPLTTDYFAVNFVYRLIGTEDEAAIVMSSNEFTTSLEASNNAQTPADLPSTIRDMGLLVGRFVVQSGSNTPSAIESAFSNTFIPAVVTNHESLLGLQGGIGGEHYHLTLADSTGTGTGLMVRQTSPTLTNPIFNASTPTHIPYWKSDHTLTLTGSLQVVNEHHVLINSGSFPDPTNPDALLVYQIHPTSVNNIGTYGDVNNYCQIYNQNFSSGSLASTDIVATSNIGGQTSSYIDMGIAGSEYNHPSWPWLQALDGYLEIDGGDLWIGTLTNNAIRFFLNNTASVGYIDFNGVHVTGSLYGTSSNAISASYANASTIADSISFVPLTSTSASWATSSVSSSYSSTASIANSISFDPLTATSASWATSSISSSYSLTASNAITASHSNHSNTSSIANSISFIPTSTISASYASSSFSSSYTLTASYSLNGGSSGTSLITGSTYPITSSWALLSISSSHTLTASIANAISFVPLTATSASWATSSLTASYAMGIPTIKSGIVNGSSFAGNPKTSSIVFGNAFPNNSYSIAVSGESSRTWTIQQKSGSGFQINSNNNGAFINNVFWQAINTGEFYS